MKTLIIRIPVRPQPTMYPPFGSMAVLQALRQKNYEFEYYDLDVHRDTKLQIQKRVLETKAPIIGISAVVSSGYKRTKELIMMIKEVAPETIIIVGGSLAWNSKVLIEKSQVDYCVIGEGLVTAQELIGSIIKNKGIVPDEEAREIKGIAFKSEEGKVEFTCFRPQINLMDQEIDDFSLVDEKFFFIDPLVQVRDSGWLRFKEDPRSHEPHRLEKKLLVMVTSKGCVARCTFCHRMEKGIRLKTMDRIVEEIKVAIDKYNVGFVFFGDEDFGASKKWVMEFCEAIKPFDILFAIQGMRVNHATPENLKALYETGCVSIFYGTESGSQKMLEVIEKKTKVEQNVNVCLWTADAGIWASSYQLVIGMPGETNETIKETIEFLLKVTENIKKREDIAISSKYILILPSTPVYEYAIRKGFIGKTLEDEENYLLSISDYDPDVYNEGFINLTNCDFYTVCNWNTMIEWEPYIHYDKKHGLSRGLFSTIVTMLTPGGLKRLKSEKNVYLYKVAMGPLNLIFNISKDLKHGASLVAVFSHTFEWFKAKIMSANKKMKFSEYVSLRKNTAMEVDPGINEHSSLTELRLGR